MNTDTGELRELQLLMKAERPTEADYIAAKTEALEALNRAERRANGTSPWVAVSPKVAAIVKAGHAAMKAKKRRRKEAAAARRRNRG